MDDTNLPIVKVDNIKKFWLSFTTWFEDELPGTGILQAYYCLLYTSPSPRDS